MYILHEWILNLSSFKRNSTRNVKKVESDASKARWVSINPYIRRLPKKEELMMVMMNHARYPLRYNSCIKLENDVKR